MARTTRSKAAATTADATTTTTVTTTAAVTKPEKKELKDGSTRTRRQQRHAVRRNLYKKAKKHQEAEVLHKTLKSADTPIGRKERSALRAQFYQPWRPRAKASSRKVTELEKLVKRQQEEIRELRKLAVGSSIPKLQPPASPSVAEVDGELEPDSSPVKIRDQLFADASRSPGGNGGAEEEEGTTILEVEEVVEISAGDDAGEPMEGVQETTLVTSVEQDVEYPTLPLVEEITQVTEVSGSAEADESISQHQQEEEHEAKVSAEGADATTDSAPALAADTPIKSKVEIRDSSADSNAGTPRNVRRSPRKKAKRRSFAGHSYVG
ncbi:hypothetical protein Daus18300_009641 [Diaporthe australafricana]|uniref:Pinin/SDK/MemA protein domain-containing protein n=1 Tax=Diaporthe australafricana TaxID=127596 RepID=A0ABR3WDN0_9PEZI